jgi:hypothetical protein
MYSFINCKDLCVYTAKLAILSRELISEVFIL